MNKKILLIDDSVTIHRVIDLCVDKEKYDVVKVFSKDEASAVLKNENPDLVLLDNKLADIKTIEMVQIIKDKCPNCYVILLAGAFDQFDKEQCDETGADDFIYKPFDAKTLDAKIACGLEGICENAGVKEEISVSEAEIKSIMPELADEDVEIPDFEDVDDMSPVDETGADEEEIAPEKEIESVKDFDGLKEIDEDLLMEAAEGGQAEQAEDTAEEETGFEDALSEAENVAAADAADEPAFEELKLDDTVTDHAEPQPVSEELPSNPFDGLIETDEEGEKEEPEEQQTEEHHEVTEKTKDIEEPQEEHSDELDDILNDINFDDETADLNAMDDAENAINISEMRIDAENAFDAAAENTTVDIPSDLDEDNIFETVDLSDEHAVNETAVADEPRAEDEQDEEFVMPEMEQSESVDLTAESAAEDDLMIDRALEEDEKKDMPAERPAVYISDEKLVEAVYEAIDEDTLKFAIKEVLTDKITRILEDELPYLVEKAIRKEIERLVKGS